MLTESHHYMFRYNNVYSRYLNRNFQKKINHRKMVNKYDKNTTSTDTKPKARDYFTKLEIATLFLQPMAVILLYFGLSWKAFQYACDVSNPSEFSNSLLWIGNKGTPPRRYVKDS